MQYTPYILPLIVSAMFTLFFGVYAWRQYPNNIARLFAFLMLAVLIWIVSVILEMLAIRLEHKLFLGDLGFIGIAPLPAIWLALVLTYTGYMKHLKKWTVIILLVFAVVTNVVIWTNDAHHLWRGEPFLVAEADNPFPVINYDYGFWANWVYDPVIYTVYFGSLFILLWAFFTVKPAFRWQILLLLIAFAIPLITSLLYVLGYSPIPHFNLTPIMFSFSGLILVLGLLHFQILDLMPVARDAVLENLRDIVLVLDTQNRVVDLNPAAQQHLSPAGLPVIGQPVSLLFPHEPDLIEIFELTTEVEADIMLDGGQAFFDLRISPLVGRDGQLIGKVVVLHDITARKAAEKALQEDYNQLQVLRQIDMELSRHLDVDYVMDRALHAAARLSKADAITISLAVGDTLVMAGGLDADVQNIGVQLVPNTGIVGRVLRQQQAELVLDVKNDPDYIEYDPAVRAQMSFPLMGHQDLLGVLSLETVDPQRFSQKTFEYLGLLATRITVALDNAYAYSEMAQLVEDLDAFSHTVAHDLKNPLSLVMGYTTMLKAELSTLSEADTGLYVDLIGQGSDKMLAIINELLLLASVRKLDEVSTAPLEMIGIVHEALGRLPDMIEAQAAEIIFDEPESWPDAVGYAPWVEEVWTNYISNAIKYGGIPPQVTLGAAVETDGMVCFWVRDNGPGLDDEQQSLLFNQFTRLDETRAQGHGLGLSIAQRIVQKLGGDVRVESAPGQGSTFSFTLPAVVGPLADDSTSP